MFVVQYLLDVDIPCLFIIIKPRKPELSLQKHATFFCVFLLVSMFLHYKSQLIVQLLCKS